MKQQLLTVLAALCLNSAIAQPTAGLKAYWSFNGNFNDGSGSGINGTNSGATATTNSAGTANSAMNFSNPTSTVVQNATHPVNANVNYGTAQDFSVEFSLYISGPVPHAGGIYDNNLNYGGYGIWYWNNSFLQVNFNFKNGNVGTTNGAIVANTWYHICCLRSAGAIKIYINGVLNASATEGTLAPVYTYAARFGTMFYNAIPPGPYNGHNGKIDEMRIYNRALSAAEITALASLPSGGPLPVKLSNFTASKTNTAVLLQWQTEFEQNSDYYSIEQSTDGIHFTSIGKVQAKGMSSVPSNYQFTDNSIGSLTNTKAVYYRLVSADKDGRTQNSGIISVRLDAGQQDGLMVLQNPVASQLNLQLNSTIKESATLIITDAGGRQLISKAVALHNGNVFTAIPVHTLAAGTYYITLISSQGKQTKSFLRQ